MKCRYNPMRQCFRSHFPTTHLAYLSTLKIIVLGKTELSILKFSKSSVGQHQPPCPHTDVKLCPISLISPTCPPRPHRRPLLEEDPVLPLSLITFAATKPVLQRLCNPTSHKNMSNPGLLPDTGSFMWLSLSSWSLWKADSTLCTRTLLVQFRQPAT